MSTSATKSARGFVSLRVKLVIGFTVIFTPVFAASYFWFYQYTTQVATYQITNDLLNTVNGAVQGMDITGFQTLYQQESTNNPNCPPAGSGNDVGGYYPTNQLYWDHVNWLHAVQAVQPQTRIYTYIKGTRPGEIIAIGSTGVFRTPRGGFKFCERYTATTGIYSGLTQRTDRWTPYHDSFGNWITTYEPIKDKTGAIVGGIGVDIPVDYVNQVRGDIQSTGTIAFVVSYLLVFALVNIAANVLTRPVVALTKVASEIGEGKYDQDVQSLFAKSLPDEIDTLTRVIDFMVGKVAEREQKLKERVHELEIRLDTHSLNREVQSIVEGDFFQDLQAKAKAIRESKSKPPADKTEDKS